MSLLAVVSAASWMNPVALIGPGIIVLSTFTLLLLLTGFLVLVGLIAIQGDSPALSRYQPILRKVLWTAAAGWAVGLLLTLLGL